MARNRNEQMKLIEDLEVAVKYDDASMMKCLMKLYGNQTKIEVDNYATVEHNGVGFNGFDAKIMTVYAQALLNGWNLKPTQLDDCRQRIMKYLPQLIRGL